VLGATGSIGTSTLDLIGREPEAFEVVALTANTSAAKLAELAIAHRAELAVIADPAGYRELQARLAGTGVAAAAGEAAVLEAASRPADWIMAAIVGTAGLRPTLQAIAQGTHLALANKECLVTAGDIVLAAVEAAGTTLLPVDSEHSAAFQAIADAPAETIERIVLTASGGPFRTWSRERLARATPAEALKHPNWSMGPKVTIDSATLMNKGLELIEAYHLFPVDVHQLGVVVHPQSLVHCLVHYRDGSVLAQMSPPDMRTPIAYSLAWPDRMMTTTPRLDLVAQGTLTFEAPDEARFPALAIARQAMLRGGSAPAVLNAANEVAVRAFLDGRLGFLDIAGLVADTLARADARGLLAARARLEDVMDVDAAARALANELLIR
jgi:1-deoxy-D-xylulose-5-phosphate reductoisomerase